MKENYPVLLLNCSDDKISQRSEIFKKFSKSLFSSKFFLTFVIKLVEISCPVSSLKAASSAKVSLRICITIPSLDLFLDHDYNHIYQIFLAETGTFCSTIFVQTWGICLIRSYPSTGKLSNQFLYYQYFVLGLLPTSCSSPTG